jgi:hypothetical protein
MKTNSQNLLSKKIYMGDIDGDQSDEIITIDGRFLYMYKSNFELLPVLQQVFSFPVTRLIIGDFVNNGREHKKDQICAILSDGSFHAFAISDDLKSLWWWFSQPNFIADDEEYMVGDFDGNGADEILVYKPSMGTLRMLCKNENGVFGEMSNFTLGNLTGFNLINKQILVGDFGQSTSQKDILVVDKLLKQVIRFDSVIENGVIAFWWAFTANIPSLGINDQVCVANVNGGDRDGIIIRHLDTGFYDIFDAEFDNGSLIQSTNVSVGQLPVRKDSGRIIASKVRDINFREESGGQRRDDILLFDENSLELISTDARFDTSESKFTYWWSYTNNVLIEPNINAKSLPWAIILCRFKGLPEDPAIEKLFREIFTVGSGGLIEYWHDASLGSIDISASKVFGWVELDVERKDASPLGREALINSAISAAQRIGLDPVNGYHKQLAVFTHNWTIDNPRGNKGISCINWETPGCSIYWIDGSADSRGRVSAPPEAHNGTFLAHEMGHGFDFDHDLASNLLSHYGDPNCIMSAMRVGTFNLQPWNLPFGPSLSFPQLISKGWMYNRRVLNVNKNWSENNNTVSIFLAPINDRTANANLGATLPNGKLGDTWDYYLEYMRPSGWNKGIGSPKFVIRRMTPEGNSAFLGEIILPSSISDAATTWTEPTGNVNFSVTLNQEDGRIIKVIVTKV